MKAALAAAKKLEAIEALSARLEGLEARLSEVVTKLDNLSAQIAGQAPSGDVAKPSGKKVGAK